VILGGDSAGGNLVASLLFLLRQLRLDQELKATASHEPEGGYLVATDGETSWSDCSDDWYTGEMRSWKNKDKAPLKSEWTFDDVRRQSTLNAIGYDFRLVQSHRVPFELDEDQREQYPGMPRAAIMLSPWVDLSENSSVHSPESWKDMKFRPYNIGVRFALAYLGLEAPTRRQAKKKEKQARREWKTILDFFQRHGTEKEATPSTPPSPDGQATPNQKAEAAHIAEPIGLELVWRNQLREHNLALCQSQGKLMPPPTTIIEQAQPVCEEPCVKTGGLAVKTDEEATTAAQIAEPIGPELVWRNQLRERNWALSQSRGKLMSPSTSVVEQAQPVRPRPEEPSGRVPVEGAEVGGGKAPEDGREDRQPAVFDICSPYISPVYGDMRGLPPLLITTGWNHLLYFTLPCSFF
jgi:transposase-like protein